MSIHPTAVISPQAKVHPTAVVGPHAVIDGQVHVGSDCRIGACAVLMGDTYLGSGCRVHAHAVIGDEPQDRAYDGGPSSVRIGNECIIREGVSIHRGTQPGSATVIGHRCMLMTNSHVGHNCELGDHVTLISGALLGGYVRVGDRAVISGNAAVHQFVRIGELSMISGLGKITRDVPPFFMVDRDGNVVGINAVGLMRSDLSLEERREIKFAHRTIYRSGLTNANAVEELTGVLTTPAGLRLLAFLSDESDRGITRSGTRRRKAA